MPGSMRTRRGKKLFTLKKTTKLSEMDMVLRLLTEAGGEGDVLLACNYVCVRSVQR